MHNQYGLLTPGAAARIKNELKANKSSIIKFCKKYGFNYLMFEYWINGYRKSKMEEQYLDALCDFFHKPKEDIKKWLS